MRMLFITVVLLFVGVAEAQQVGDMTKLMQPLRFLLVLNYFESSDRGIRAGDWPTRGNLCELQPARREKSFTISKLLYRSVRVFFRVVWLWSLG